MSAAVVICLVGIVVAVVAHIGAKTAERRAGERYRELVGGDADLPEDGWKGIGPLAGRWGCIVTTLELLRSLGLFLTLGAGLYLVAG
jgi:hypothetical protein